MDLSLLLQKTINLKEKLFKRPWAKALGLFLFFIFIVWLVLPKPDLLGDIYFSQAFYDDKGKLLRLTTTKDEKFRSHTDLNRMSKNIIETTLLFEDRYFFVHPGVNPIAITKAFLNTYVFKSYRMGASTITMQLARIRYGLHTNSIKGKLYQILKAIQIERHYSKKEILEAYLNLAPYGRNIEGIGAASLIYFQKHPENLTLHEALTLAIIPQSPKRRTPFNNLDYNNEDLIYARSRLVNLWVEKHNADMKKISTLELPLSTSSPEDLPFIAPHLTDFLFGKHPHKGRYDTTLNLEMQRMLERTAKSYIEKNKKHGLNNTSAMILNYKTMEVKALLGSVDFYSNLILGQVNGTQGKRSPGSTLKPFIYGLAIDQGLIHPQTMLKDSPMSFGAFNPENFDDDFTGPIKAKDALIRSRNIPAITLARDLKEPSLYELLISTGVKKLKSEEHYGLALTLGGAELTMEELVKLYALLANKGVYKNIRYLKDDPISQGKRLIGEEAMVLTLNILKDNPRPDRGSLNKYTEQTANVYWKTGTSQGFRDAWSIGIIGEYVVATWVGNFAGPGDPAFIGATAAAPLFFEITDALKNGYEIVDPLKDYENENIKTVKVCSVSGHLPSKFCPLKTDTWFIPGVSPITKCEIHREVLIDDITGLRSCGEKTKKIRKEVFEFWPSDLLRIFKKAGIPRRVVPPYNKNCRDKDFSNDGFAPKITSPLRNVSYTIRLEDDGKNTIPFVAVTDSDVKSLYWFIDSSYVGKSTDGEPFFWAGKGGKFIVRTIDDAGRFDSMEFQVEVVK